MKTYLTKNCFNSITNFSQKLKVACHFVVSLKTNKYVAIFRFCLLCFSVYLFLCCIHERHPEAKLIIKLLVYCCCCLTNIRQFVGIAYIRAFKNHSIPAGNRLFVMRMYNLNSAESPTFEFIILNKYISLEGRQ